MRAADGTTVDASVIPERGAPTRIAIVSGFTEGWYELIHADGRTDRVMWHARKLPVLWVYGEFGATKESPYRDRFYALALQPLSRNPYPRSTTILDFTSGLTQPSPLLDYFPCVSPPPTS